MRNSRAGTLLIVVVVILASLSLVAYASNSTNSGGQQTSSLTLAAITGATEKQLEYIEDVLARHDIFYKTVAISNNPIVDGMDNHWAAYDLYSDDGAYYVCILRKSDCDFTAILDCDGRLLEGMIDSGVTPALYINGDYVFSR